MNAPPRTVRVIQHLPHEHAGVLGEVLTVLGVDTHTVRAWTGEAIPQTTEDVAALVVLGGDMNTDESEAWPHLDAVRTSLTNAVEAGTPTLGLCLGAQLLAEATGGSVSHGTPEIGYPPVRLTPSGRTHPVLGVLQGWSDPLAESPGAPVFNAHADQIALPPSAQLLAFSDATPVHAFEVGSALGLQFHAEIDASYVAAYIATDGIEEYLAASNWSGQELLVEAQRRNTAHRALGQAIFAAWCHTAQVT